LADTVCEQLGQLPLVRGRGSDGVSFRVLALDGGGIKGTFTASVLATWEQQTGLRIVDHFDLVAGTSTGGILGIGLGIGLSAKQMLDFYRQRGPTIFPITSMARKLKHGVRHVFRPKYSQEVLLRELESGYYLNKKPILLGESKCRLLIPAYHAVAGASHVFRTPHHQLLTGDAKIESAHVALATAAAPTFFSAAKVGNMIAESTFFDGGVWANSPAMAAIIEATCFLNVPLDRIDVLSVGTTDEPFTVRKQARSGILRWGKKLVRLLMTAQAESSLKQARLLAGEPRFLRVNVTTPPGSYTLDSPGEIEELATLGNREADKPEVLGQVRSRFLNGVFVAPWERFG
jgi:patatin-like phospholipase/acyl hydrolase